MMATSATAAEKCGIAEDMPSEDDKDLARLYSKCGNVYINEKVVVMCLVEIRHLIDIPCLKDHLLKHQVINNHQLAEITNPYHSYDDQVDNLLKHVGRSGGKHGYFLLYVSLCESSENQRSHKEAVQELHKKSIQMKVSAPESIIRACCMLYQELELKHNGESSGEAESGYESTNDYKYSCGGGCNMNDCECPNPTKDGYPYLSLPSNSYEALQLETKLSKQSEIISKEFADVAYDTFQRLSKIAFDDVQRYTKHVVSTGNYKKEVSGLQADTSCIAATSSHKQLEDLLMQNYYSWFNFSVIKDLRKKFLFPVENDEVLQSYMGKLSLYCKRRCFESPLSFHPRPVSANLRSLIFKVDSMFGDYKLLDVQKIYTIVADVIKSPKHAIYVKSVNEGCVEVSCYILPQFEVDHLSEVQISQLKDHNIFSFKMEDKELMPSCQHYLYHGTGYNFEQAESCSGYDTNSEKEPKSNSEDTKRFSEEDLDTFRGFEEHFDRFIASADTNVAILMVKVAGSYLHKRYSKSVYCKYFDHQIIQFIIDMERGYASFYSAKYRTLRQISICAHKLNISQVAVIIRTPRQVQAYGIMLSDKYLYFVNEIRRLHAFGEFEEADKVVECCRLLTVTSKTKGFGLEMLVAVTLKNCSGYVARIMSDKVISVVTEAKQLCQQIDNDNGRILEGRCEWVLACMYRCVKDFDKAMEHIENAQLLQLQYNIAPGEDTSLCYYLKGCMLAFMLAKSKAWSTELTVFEEAKFCLQKSIDHANRIDFTHYQTHQMIRFAQLCLHSSNLVPGNCANESQMREAEAALNSHYIDENILGPQTKCILCLTRSDLYRNKKQLEMAQLEAQRALDIADGATMIASAKERLIIVKRLKRYIQKRLFLLSRVL